LKKTVTIHQDNMTEEGPMIEVLLDLPEGTFNTDDGQVFPLTQLSPPFERIKAIALIDTGASSSTIDSVIADKMRLTIFNESTGTDVAGIKREYRHSAIKMFLPAEPEDIEVGGEIIRMPLDAHNFDIIIGRNLLSGLTFIYNGKEQYFTLEFDN